MLYVNLQATYIGDIPSQTQNRADNAKVCGSGSLPLEISFWVHAGASLFIVHSTELALLV